MVLIIVATNQVIRFQIPVLHSELKRMHLHKGNLIYSVGKLDNYHFKMLLELRKQDFRSWSGLSISLAHQYSTDDDLV